MTGALNLFFGMTSSFPSSFSHIAWFKKARSGHNAGWSNLIPAANSPMALVRPIIES
jgi:hypothetical protein